MGHKVSCICFNKTSCCKLKEPTATKTENKVSPNIASVTQIKQKSHRAVRVSPNKQEANRSEHKSNKEVWLTPNEQVTKTAISVSNTEQERHKAASVVPYRASGSFFHSDSLTDSKISSQIPVQVHDSEEKSSCVITDDSFGNKDDRISQSQYQRAERTRHCSIQIDDSFQHNMSKRKNSLATTIVQCHNSNNVPETDMTSTYNANIDTTRNTDILDLKSHQRKSHRAFDDNVINSNITFNTQMSLYEDNRVEKPGNIYNIHLPNAQALAIGNDNAVYLEQNKKADADFVRVFTDKVLEKMILFPERERGPSIFLNEYRRTVLPPVDPEYTEKSSKSSLKRSKSQRKSQRRKESVVKGLAQLQDKEWTQYRDIRRELLYTVVCKLKQCKSEIEIKETASAIKSDLCKTIETKTNELETFLSTSKPLKSSLSKSKKHHNWKENILKSIKGNHEKLKNEANTKLAYLENERKEEIKRSHNYDVQVEQQRPSQTIRQISHDMAESFITLIEELIIPFVQTLLPLCIQHEIVVKTFECQKSYVLKMMMKEFAEGEVKRSVHYISEANKYASEWIKDFTVKTVFKKVHGKHIYSTCAETEIKTIINELKEVVKNAPRSSFIEWANHFFSSIKTRTILPITAERINEMKGLFSNVELSSFLSIFNSRLNYVEDGAVNHFKLARNFPDDWPRDFYDEIMERLWGCNECCPFCHEPCEFSDKEHIEWGYNHQCIQHRPLGITGFMNTIDNQLVTKNCNDFVDESDQGYKFLNQETLRRWRDYKVEFPSWKIDRSEKDSEPYFWIWLMRENISLYANIYGALVPDFPDKFKTVTRSDAFKSLESVYVFR